MESPQWLTELLQILFGASIGSGGLFLWFRKQIAASNRNTAHSRAEISLLEALQKQYKEASVRAAEAEHERTKALREVSKLQAQVVVMSERISMLQQQLEHTQQELQSARTEFRALSDWLHERSDRRKGHEDREPSDT